MDGLDTLMLSRIQFAANITFHILFPTITIALGWILVYFKWQYNRSNDMRWMDTYRLWTKVFALSFAMGVVSGITMSFQFGTNWPGFMERVGNVAGPLLAYEVLTAFFLEATFVGVMLFGFGRVSNRVHTIATVLVAVGTTMSAFWILVLNSWMHTPAGYEIREGVVHASDWWAIVFNPSMPYRFVHTLLSSGLTAAFLMAGIGAFLLLRNQDGPVARTSLRTGIFLGAILIPLQIVSGDLHGLNTLEHQPAKVAAMEGNWETRGNVPLVLFALPDEAARENRFEIAIPNGASLILKHEAAGVVPGLNEFVLEDGSVMHPPVAPVFFAFRIMVGVGLLMLAVSWYVGFRLWRGRTLGRPTLWVVFAMTFSGWVATIAGWYTTEIGRQPWLVEGILLTREAVTTTPAGLVAGSLVGYLVVYAFLMSAYIGTLFHLARKNAPGAPGAGIAPTPSAPETRLPAHA